jgi:beta-1,4-N-acetylglucosaminyltransferase
MLSVILVLEALAFLVVLRLLAIAPRGRGPAVKRDKNNNADSNNKTATTASLAVFLGSGGHTAEMRALLASVDRQRYTPRTYVYCAGDDMSLRAVADFEASTQVPGSAGAGARNPDYSLLSLPRARAVGEGKLSTLVSASKTFAVALWHVFALPTMARPRAPWADVLILNGPGTAVVLVAAVYIRRVGPKQLREACCCLKRTS